jgi:lactate permease
MFHQILSPAGNLALTWLLALMPVVLLLVLLAVFRVSAWLAALLALPVIPLRAFSNNVVLLTIGAFLIQFFVQGAWGGGVGVWARLV